MGRGARYSATSSVGSLWETREVDPADLLSRYGDRVTHVERVPALRCRRRALAGLGEPSVRAVFEAEGARSCGPIRPKACASCTTVGTWWCPPERRPASHWCSRCRRSRRSRADVPAALCRATARPPCCTSRRPRRSRPTSADGCVPPRTLVRAATVDGDNSRDERDWARDHADYALTNPDTLHHSILPGHPRWTRLLGGLRYVVVDECHHYRGVFGAHVAHVLRRLRRVCAHYGVDPAVHPVVGDRGRAGRLRPPPHRARRRGRHRRRISARGPHRRPVGAAADRRSALRPSLRTADRRPPRRRRSSPTSSSEARGRWCSCGRGAAPRRSRPAHSGGSTTSTRPSPRTVATYRGGYLPEERRELEQRLRGGDLLGLASTNALELGIDVAGLDAVVSVGFPGHSRRLAAAAGSRRAGRQGVVGRAGGAGRTARHVPRAPSRGVARSARGGVGLRPGQPVRAGTAPRRGRARAAAHRRRHRAVRAAHGRRHRGPRGGRLAATS